MADHDELVQQLFTKYVKPKGLPPRLAGEIKHAMVAAAKKSKGDKKATKSAITTYLTERNRDPETGAKLDKPKKEKKAKKAKKEKKVKPLKKRGASSDDDAKPKRSKKPAKDAPDPAKDALVAKGAKKALKGSEDAGVPKGNIDLRKLNRATLKGMAKDLGLKYKKKWTDDELRAKVAAGLIGMDDRVTAELAKADPAKIEALDDCIGLMLDLTKATCITCPAQEDCRKLFEQHRQDGFQVFASLQPGETKAASDIPASTLTKKLDKKKGDTFVADRPIEVYDAGKVAKLPKVSVDGAEVPDNLEHKAFLIAIKKAVPSTLGEFRDVVLKHYNPTDADKEGAVLTMWFVRYCTALGMAKVL